jgi:hypothetical protein
MSDLGWMLRQARQPEVGGCFMTQRGGLVLHDLETTCLGFLFTPGGREAPRGEGLESPRKPGWGELPGFLSPAPPRSEGEALLRRIFSRGEPV